MSTNQQRRKNLRVLLPCLATIATMLPGYTYSLALRSADLTWSADSLDQWLAGPRKFISGVKMQIRVLDASPRRDARGRGAAKRDPSG
jgi:hypothetical protein